VVLSDEFLAKVRKDFADYCQSKDIDEYFDFNTYLAGYIACLKRFGGSNGKEACR
jgi:hypothetical protein